MNVYMKNQRGFVWRPILLGVLIVTALGSVWYFVFYKTISPTAASQLTKEQVSNGYDQCGTQFENGFFNVSEEKHGCATYSKFDPGRILFADIDADDISEALVPVETVGPSSASRGLLYVFKNVDGTARVIDSISFGWGNGEVMSVDKNTVVVESNDSFNLDKILVETYQFVDGHLKLSSSQTVQDESVEWRTYTNAKYGLTIQYPCGARCKDDPPIPEPGGSSESSIALPTTQSAVYILVANFTDETVKEFNGVHDPGSSGPGTIFALSLTSMRTALQLPVGSTCKLSYYYDNVTTAQSTCHVVLVSGQKALKFTSYEDVLSKGWYPSIDYIFNRGGNLWVSIEEVYDVRIDDEPKIPQYLSGEIQPSAAMQIYMEAASAVVDTLRFR